MVEEREIPLDMCSLEEEKKHRSGHTSHISSYEYSEGAVFQGSAVLILLSQKSLLLLLNAHT